MSLREHGVRVRDVLTAAVAAAAIAYLALTWSFRRDATLPPVSWAVALVLIVVCVGLALAGRRVRATVRQTARRPLEPLAAYRVLRLAQACALTGGLVAGGYLAYAAVALPDIDASSVRAAALSALAVAASGGALCAVGLWVQSMCRIDPPDDVADEPDDAGDFYGPDSHRDFRD